MWPNQHLNHPFLRPKLGLPSTARDRFFSPPPPSFWPLQWVLQFSGKESPRLTGIGHTYLSFNYAPSYIPPPPFALFPPKRDSVLWVVPLISPPVRDLSHTSLEFSTESERNPSLAVEFQALAPGRWNHFGHLLKMIHLKVEYS